jgi:hypothetical protein
MEKVKKDIGLAYNWIIDALKSEEPFRNYQHYKQCVDRIIDKGLKEIDEDDYTLIYRLKLYFYSQFERKE